MVEDARGVWGVFTSMRAYASEEMVMFMTVLRVQCADFEGVPRAWGCFHEHQFNYASDCLCVLAGLLAGLFARPRECDSIAAWIR